MKSLSNLFADFSTSEDGEEGTSGAQDDGEKGKKMSNVQKKYYLD